MLAPLYRALCVAALRRDGVLEPSVNATGDFFDGASNLLKAGDGVALALQAKYDVECGSAHGVVSDDLIDALHDAARTLAAQHSIEAQ